LATTSSDGEFGGTIVGNKFLFQSSVTSTLDLVNFIQVDFSPPAMPFPQAWVSTVVLSWPGGSTQLPLKGTTAGLFASVAEAQPIQLNAGAATTVSIALEYDSVDAASIDVNLGPGPTELDGLKVSSITQNMPATYFEAPATPKGKAPQPGTPAFVETLVLKRKASVKVPVSSIITIKPGNQQVAEISVVAPSLPQEIAGPLVLKAMFDIIPAPIKVEAVNSPITVIRGKSAPVSISVNYPGAQTTLTFSDPPGYSNLKVVGAEYIGNGATTSGTINDAFQIAVAEDDSDHSIETVTINVPWTANEGLSKGQLSVTIKILPSVLIFTCPMFPNQEDVTCAGVLTVGVDGNYNFTGNVHSGNIIACNYAVALIVNAASSTGSSSSPEQLISASATGTVGPDISGGAGDQWNKSGSDANIEPIWPQIVDSSQKWSFYAGDNAWSETAAILGVPLAVIGLGVGVTFFDGSSGPTKGDPSWPKGDAPQ
jgi:hypothetical protein